MFESVETASLAAFNLILVRRSEWRRDSVPISCGIPDADGDDDIGMGGSVDSKGGEAGDVNFFSLSPFRSSTEGLGSSCCIGVREMTVGRWSDK